MFVFVLNFFSLNFRPMLSFVYIYIYLFCRELTAIKYPLFFRNSLCLFYFLNNSKQPPPTPKIISEATTTHRPLAHNKNVQQAPDQPAEHKNNQHFVAHRRNQPPLWHSNNTSNNTQIKQCVYQTTRISNHTHQAIHIK